MLDLNLASSGDPPAVPDELRGGEGFEGEPSDDSSLLNAEAPSAGGDDDSCSTRPAAALRFDILKGGKKSEEALVSRQLFPLPLAPAVALPSWVDPSFGRAGVAALPMARAPPHQKQAKRSRRGPQSRSSQYRGVTFYRRTGRWESHIWDCGKQVYLGGFDTAHAAARAYDRAAIKFRGVDADINFILSDYEDDMKLMNNLSKDEFVHVLRRQSTGFSRGSSKYRGVTPHKCGPWEAGTRKLLGKNAYNKADIYCKEREAVTNFEPITYERELLPEGDSEGTLPQISGTLNINFGMFGFYHHRGVNLILYVNYFVFYIVYFDLAVSDNLDLNLRISQPNIGSSKRDDRSMGIHFKLDPLKAPDSEKARIDAQSSHLVLQPHDFPVVLEHPYVWTSQLPGFFPNTEVRAADKSHNVVPFALPNLMWQMPSSRPLLPFLSAASSGFLTTTKTAACPPQPLPSSRHPALHLPPSIL